MALSPRARRLLLLGCAVVAAGLLWIAARDQPVAVTPPPPAPDSAPRSPARAALPTRTAAPAPRALLDPEAVLAEHEGPDAGFVEDDLGERGWLVVLARLPDGAPAVGARVRAKDCGLNTRTLGDGVATAPPPPGACRLTVDWAEPGRLCSWGPQRLDVPGGVVVGVDAELACEARQDLGLRVSPTPGGWRVRAVEPGGTADAAGIAPGNHILAVDGQATDDLDAPEEWLSPPPGVAVWLTLRGAGGTRDLRLGPPSETP
jgi:hypothetical protein